MASCTTFAPMAQFLHSLSSELDPQEYLPVFSSAPAGLVVMRLRDGAESGSIAAELIAAGRPEALLQRAVPGMGRAAALEAPADIPLLSSLSAPHPRSGAGRRSRG
jgi:hypothetical protein